MIKAKFQLGMLTVDCSGATPSEALLDIQKEQDVFCLANHAHMFGEGDQADRMLDDYFYPAMNGELTLEQLRTLNINFSIGSLRCLLAEEVHPA